MLLRRDALNTVGGFDLRLDSGEDRDVAAKFIKSGKTIGLSHDCFVLHNYDFGLLRVLRR
jgi:hypothetical protein